MSIPLLDLRKTEYAEAIFRFMSEKTERDQYFETLATGLEDLSLAQYVRKYRYHEFCLWYHLNYEDAL